MSTSTLAIRTDFDTKQAIADFAASIGLSTSAFVTTVTLQAMRERRVVLTPPLEPTPYLENITNIALADRANGQNVSKFKNRQSALDHLRSL